MPYEIIIVANAQDDLDVLRAYDRRIILHAIETHLRHRPTRTSGRIRELAQPAISRYRLRAGDHRVYYDVDEENRRVIIIQVYKKGRSGTPKEEGEALR